MIVGNSNFYGIGYSPINNDASSNGFFYFLVIQKRITIDILNLHHMYILKFSILDKIFKKC